MSTPDRDDLLARHRRELDDWWGVLEAGLPPTEAEFETASRRNWLEAARHYDPTAALGEELIVRLRGPKAEDGGLSFSIGDALLKPLQDSVSSAANDDVELEIVSLSQGSTVLHVRPRSVQEVEEEHEVRVDSSSVDHAMRALLRLVAAVEHQQDVREWLGVLGSLDRLVDALQKFDLNVNLTWFALDGEARVAELTAQGRTYYLGLQDTTKERSHRPITGRVTELREAGVVKIKAGSSRRSPAYEVRVEPADLIGMHLELGQLVGFLVREDVVRDKLGREHGRTWTYVRHLSSGDSFDDIDDIDE